MITDSGLRSNSPAPASAGRFWATRAGLGLLFGIAITTLEFAYYIPLAPVSDREVLVPFLSLMLVYTSECLVVTLAVAAIDRCLRPRELRAWGLVLAVLAGVVLCVPMCRAFFPLVLRDHLGMRLFADYMGQQAIGIASTLYHAWILLFFGGLGAVVCASLRSRARILAALRAVELRNALSRRRLAQASLAAFQERVDPERLLRELARLEQCYADDPVAADRVLEELVEFLRAGMAQARAPYFQSTQSLV